MEREKRAMHGRGDVSQGTLDAMQKFSDFSFHSPENLKMFPDRVKNLHASLIQEIRIASTPIANGANGTNDTNGADSQRSSMSVIKEFLHTDSTNMDSCTRWTLFHLSVNIIGQANTDQETSMMDLIRMILEKDVLLAYENKTYFQDGCEMPEARGFRGKSKPGGGGGGQGGKNQGHLTHYKPESPKETMFERAVRVGNHHAIELILDLTLLSLLADPETGEANAKKKLMEMVRRKKKTRSALELAMESENIADVLDTLFRMLPGIMTDDDSVLGSAVEEGSVDVIEKLLEHDGPRALLTKRKHIITALNLVAVSRGDEAVGVENVAKKIIEASSDEEKYHLEVLGTIIKHDLVDIWEEHKSRIPDSLIPFLLHVAVLYQNLRFVNEFLKRPQDVLCKRSLADVINQGRPEKEYFPLWYNNNQIRKDGKWEIWKQYVHRLNDTEAIRSAEKTRAAIRSVIVYNTVKYATSMQSLSEIFQESGARELCFDMSRITVDANRVSEFVQSLTMHDKRQGLLKYEETIRYAEFPVLDKNSAEKEWPEDHSYIKNERTEVFNTLDWLATKGVKRIISLRVPDYMMNPHSELRITYYVQKFRVEELDWRFLDLSMSIFEPLSDYGPDRASVKKTDKTTAVTEEKEDPRKQITTLHLYSSGKRAVLRHWFSNEGIPALIDLKHIHIHIIKELMTAGACTSTYKYIYNELQKLPRAQKSLTSSRRLLEPHIKQEFWNPTQQLVQLNEMRVIPAQRIAPRLAEFTESYRKYVLLKFKDKPNDYLATKVAIIDNGILSISPQAENAALPEDTGDAGQQVGEAAAAATEDGPRVLFFEKGNLWPRIKEGQSFVHEQSRGSAWYLASDPHGTQMANLMCAIDPLCELYVAKVVDGKYGYSPERVAKAVEWAVREKVDVISMSFTIDHKDGDEVFKENKEKFSAAVKAAADAGIIMVCSWHDEGDRVGTVYPASFKSERKLVMAACDEFGKLIPDVKPNESACQFDFRISSQNVVAGVIPFLSSSDRISGSSVATALAAGLCSLTLSCRRLGRHRPLQGNEEQKAKMENYETVRKVLTDMTSEVEKKFLLLEKFGGIDKTKEGEGVNMKTVLHNIAAI